MFMEIMILRTWLLEVVSSLENVDVLLSLGNEEIMNQTNYICEIKEDTYTILQKMEGESGIDQKEFELAEMVLQQATRFQDRMSLYIEGPVTINTREEVMSVIDEIAAMEQDDNSNRHYIAFFTGEGEIGGGIWFNVGEARKAANEYEKLVDMVKLGNIKFKWKNQVDVVIGVTLSVVYPDWSSVVIRKYTVGEN